MTETPFLVSSCEDMTNYPRRSGVGMMVDLNSLELPRWWNYHRVVMDFDCIKIEEHIEPMIIKVEDPFLQPPVMSDQYAEDLFL